MTRWWWWWWLAEQRCRRDTDSQQCFTELSQTLCQHWWLSDRWLSVTHSFTAVISHITTYWLQSVMRKCTNTNTVTWLRCTVVSLVTADWLIINVTQYLCRSVLLSLWHTTNKSWQTFVGQLSWPTNVCRVSCWPTFFVGQLLLAKFEHVLFLLANFPELLNCDWSAA